MKLRSLLLSAAIALPVLASAGSLFSSKKIDSDTLVYVSSCATPTQAVHFSFTVDTPDVGGTWGPYPHAWSVGQHEDLSGDELVWGDLDIPHGILKPASGDLTITYLDANGAPTQKQCKLHYKARGELGNSASTNGEYCGGVTASHNANYLSFVVGAPRQS